MDNQTRLKTLRTVRLCLQRLKRLEKTLESLAPLHPSEDPVFAKRMKFLKRVFYETGFAPIFQQDIMRRVKSSNNDKIAMLKGLHEIGLMRRVGEGHKVDPFQWYIVKEKLEEMGLLENFPLPQPPT